MAKHAFPKRRDSKHRILRRGESVREDGLYQFKYHVNGRPKFIYSWRLEPTDKLPPGKKPCLSLREMEKLLFRLCAGVPSAAPHQTRRYSSGARLRAGIVEESPPQRRILPGVW